MMAVSNSIEVNWLEDSTAVLMARVEDRPVSPGTAGTAFTQASFSAITYSVYDVSNESAPVVVTGHDAVALTISSVIFDTLQGWSKDSTGHNFRYTLDATAFPVGGRRYRVDVKLTHTDGRVGFIRYEGAAAKVYSS